MRSQEKVCKACEDKKTFHCLCRHPWHAPHPQRARPSRWLHTPVEASWLNPGSPPVRLTWTRRCCWSPGRQHAPPPWRLAWSGPCPSCRGTPHWATHIGIGRGRCPSLRVCFQRGITAVPAATHVPSTRRCGRLRGGVVVVVIAAPCLGAIVWLWSYPRGVQGLCQRASRGEQRGRLSGAWPSSAWGQGRREADGVLRCWRYHRDKITMIRGSMRYVLKVTNNRCLANAVAPRGPRRV